MYNIQFEINNNINTLSVNDSFFINPVMFYLKHYYELSSKHAGKINWLEESYYDSKTDLSNVDILCVTCLLWNMRSQISLIQKAKKQYPNLIIIAGGGMLDAHLDPNFFKKYPEIDYVSYGDGEIAFKTLMDGIIENDFKNLNNIVVNNNGVAEVSPHIMLNDNNFKNESSILSQADIIEKTVNRIVNIRGSIIGISMIYEYTRGCPYACSFCDWGQMLSNKVTIKNTDYKKELDLFKKLDIMPNVSDANFGITKHDKNIFDYAASIYDPGKNFKLRARNIVKLNKDMAFYFHKNEANNFYTDLKDSKTLERKMHGRQPRISLQSIDSIVLEAINRPDTPWEENVLYIKNLSNNIPQDVIIELEMIAGLPEQTLGGWIESLVTINNDLIDINYNITLFPWNWLPNAGAAKGSYKSDYGIEYIDNVYMYNDELDNSYRHGRLIMSSAVEYDKLINNSHCDEYMCQNIVYQTNSYKFYELLMMMRLNNINNYNNEEFSIIISKDKLMNKLKEKCILDATLMMKAHETYGFMIFSGHDAKRNFVPYTVLCY